MKERRNLHDIWAGSDDKVCVQWSHVVLVAMEVVYSEWAKDRSGPQAPSFVEIDFSGISNHAAAQSRQAMQVSHSPAAGHTFDRKPKRCMLRRLTEHPAIVINV